MTKPRASMVLVLALALIIAVVVGCAGARAVRTAEDASQVATALPASPVPTPTQLPSPTPSPTLQQLNFTCWTPQFRDRIISSSSSAQVKIGILYAIETLERTYDTLRCRGKATVEGDLSRSIVYFYKVDGSGAVSIGYDMGDVIPTPTPISPTTLVPSPTPTVRERDISCWDRWFRDDIMRKARSRGDSVIDISQDIEFLERTDDALRCRAEAVVEDGLNREIVYSFHVSSRGVTSMEYELGDTIPTPTPLPTATPVPTATPTPPIGEQYLELFKANCEENGVGVLDGHYVGDIGLGLSIQAYPLYMSEYSDHPSTIIYPDRILHVSRPQWIPASVWQAKGMPLAADGAYQPIGICMLVTGFTWEASGDEWKADHEIMIELVPVGDSSLSFGERTFGEGYYYLPWEVYEGAYQIRMWWTGDEYTPLDHRFGKVNVFVFVASAPGKTERE